jgi:predicted acylesterase/phospholipase RssA
MAFLLLAALSPRPAGGQACEARSTALVLAGGGARGLAHIGVIRAIERAGIRPDFVVGTSMGALIGALYASGYTADQLEETLDQLTNFSAFRSYAPRAPASLRHLPVTVLFERTPRGFVLQNAAVRQGDINAMLDALLLRGNLEARGNFDALPIPFRAVATDINDRTTVVLRRGDLAQAVRASIALPLLFSPVQIGAHLLADGGLSDNVPVDAARELGVQRVIVSRVKGATDSVDYQSQLAYAGHLVNLLFRQGAPVLQPGDVDIITPVADVSRLDFSLPTARMVVRRGDETATSVLASQCHSFPASQSVDATEDLRSQVQEPARVSVVRAAHPNDVVDVKHLLGLRPGILIDVPALADRLQSLKGARAIEGIWLHPSGTRDSLELDVEVERAPRTLVGAGFAYDSDLGGRVWTGLVDRQLAGRAIEGSVVLAGGTYRQEVSLGLRRVNPMGVNALTPVAGVTVAYESIRTFDSTGVAGLPLEIREAVSLIGIERAFREEWVATIAAETRAWADPSGRDRSGFGPRVSVAWLPSDGRGSLEMQSVFTDRYKWAEAEAGYEFGFGRLSLRPRLRAAWGQSLPLHLTFPIGGKEGFAGLRRDELRGDTERLAAVVASFRITGQLLMRVEFMAGQIAYQSYSVADSADAPATVVVPQPDRVSGVRGGFGADTPVGPVRVEYGLNSRRRHSVFIRLGRWF